MKKNIAIILSILLLGSPAFADGGIPLWGLNTSVFFAVSGLLTAISFKDLFSALPLIILFWLFTIFLLVVVVFVETFVVSLHIKMNYNELFKIVFKSNLISMVVGIILLVLPAPFVWESLNTMKGAILGPWSFWGAYSLFLYNFLCLPLSYVIEYNIAKIKLQGSCDLSTIKKSFLYANIATYALPILIYGIACVFQIKNSVK